MALVGIEKRTTVFGAAETQHFQPTIFTEMQTPRKTSLPTRERVMAGMSDAVRIAHFVDCMMLSIYGEQEDYELSGDYRG